MGLINVELKVRSLRNVKKSRQVLFLIDSGAEYSVVPASVLRSIGVESNRTVTVIMADGTPLKRKVGDAFFSYEGIEASSPVIFGEKNDDALLGAVTLESLGCVLHPLERRITIKDAIRM